MASPIQIIDAPPPQSYRSMTGGYEPRFNPAEADSAVPASAAPASGGVYMGEKGWVDKAQAQLDQSGEVRITLGTSGPRPKGALALEQPPMNTAARPSTGATAQVFDFLGQAAQAAGQVYTAKMTADAQARANRDAFALEKERLKFQQKMGGGGGGGEGNIIPFPGGGGGSTLPYIPGQTKDEQYHNLMRYAMIAAVVIIGGVVVMRMTSRPQVIQA